MNSKNPWSQRTAGCHCAAKRGLPFVVSAFTQFDGLCLVPEKAREWDSKRREGGRHGQEGSRIRGLGDRLLGLTGYLDSLPTLGLGNHDLMRQVKREIIKCDQRWKVWWKKAKTWRSNPKIATRSFLLPSVWVVSCHSLVCTSADSGEWWSHPLDVISLQDFHIVVPFFVLRYLS